MNQLITFFLLLGQFSVANIGYSWFWSETNPFEWCKAEELTCSSSNCKRPDISLCGPNKGAAVWLQWEGNQNVVHGCVKTQNGWLQPKRISEADGEHFHLQVASNEQDQSIAIWSNKSGESCSIEAALHDGVWMQRIALSKCKGRALYPQVSINESGDAVASWSEHSPKDSLIKASCFSMNQWSPPITLSASNKIGAYPSIAQNESGQAIVAWLCYDQGSTSIEVSIYEDGSWSPSVTLSNSNVSSAGPVISLNDDGVATVIWVTDERESSVIQGAELSGGKWTSLGDISKQQHQVFSPAIVSHSTGKKVVLWEQLEKSNHRHVYARVFDGKKWQNPSNLCESPQNARFSQLSMNKSGDVVALWQNRNEKNDPPYISKLKGTTWSSAKKVPLKSALHTSEPKVSLGRNSELAIIRCASSSDPLVIGKIDLQEGAMKE